MNTPFNTAAVIGTGMMGPGIATTLLLGGLKVTLLSRSLANAASACTETLRQLEVLRDAGLIDAQKAAGVAGGLSSTSDFDGCIRTADLVVESVPEDMKLKQELFARMDRLNDRAVLASNTSGLSITAIASGCQQPERVITTHFWNPPHLMPLVEIVSGAKTDPSLPDQLVQLLTGCGKIAVKVKKDTPGQLGNRLQHALYREAMHIVQEGIADVEDVDQAAKAGFGLRLPVYGIFEHQDAVGLELSASVANYVMPDLYSKPQPPAILAEKIARGELGPSTGQGFYDWSKKDIAAVKARRDAFVLEFLKSQKRAASAS